MSVGASFIRVSQPLRKPATMADLEALPPGVKGEIIDGELYTQPRPRARHSEVILSLGGRLRNSFGIDGDGPAGWILLAEPGIELPAAPEVSPDLAGWRVERWVWPPPEEPIRIVPDWVCEVLSPSNARYDRKIKFPFYAKVGVQHLWIVDPTERTLEVRRLQGALWAVIATFADDDVLLAEPFEAVGIPLGRFWVDTPLK